MQAPRGTAIQIMLVLLIGTVTVLHLVAGVRERRRDRTTAEPGRGSDFIRQSQGNQPECQSSTLPLNGVRSTSSDVIPEANWIMACRVEDIPPDRARIIRPAGGERIAVFRHGNRISAVTNVCAHQGGPLGEGKIINGCITCPWHGWTYQPHDGCAPPPFDEKIATYGVKIVDNIVYVDSIPLSPGTDTSPACFGDEKNVQSTAG